MVLDRVLASACVDQDPTHGWDAIINALAALYPEQEAHHWGTLIPWALGGPDPLHGVSAYDAGDHWHYVSLGLTELFAKEGEDQTTSGYGFEFTFRLAKGKLVEPPVWPASFMQNLARYVFQSGNVFFAGHHMDANGPIAADEDTLLTALLIASDPDLPGHLMAPNGRFEFLQIVGVAADELAAAKAWKTDAMLALMRIHNPKLVSDLSRPSLLSGAEFANACDEGRRRDGSSTGVLHNGQFHWEAMVSGPQAKVVIEVGALVVDTLLRTIAGRIPFGRELLLLGNDGVQIVLRPGPEFEFSRGTQGLEIVVPAAAAQSIEKAFPATRGEWSVPGFEAVIFRVLPTEILSQDGQVAQTIG